MSVERNEISVSLRDLVAFLLRGAVLAAVLAVAAGGVAYYLGLREDPVFRADSTLLVVRSTAGGQIGLTSVTAPPIDLAAYQVAVGSDVVIADAVRALGLAAPTAADLRRVRSSVGSSVETGIRDSSLLRIEGRAPTPDLAVARANAVAVALVAWDRRRASETLSRGIETLNQQIGALTEQIRELQVVGDAAAQSQVDGLVRLRAEQQQQMSYLRALIASAEGLVSVLQGAETTVRQVAPRPALTAVVAALLAVAFAYLVLLVMAAFNTRMRTGEDIAAATGAPVLAEFPVARTASDAWRLREASSYLRAKLLFATSDVHPKVFMVTSAQDAEGKTTVSQHLAEGFVRYGYRTLLVDADLRSPSMLERYQVLGSVEDATPLRGWLQDPEGRHRVLRINLEGEGELDLVPQFDRSIDAPEALGRGFWRLLERWAPYDVVVIDTPPVLAVADPLIVAPLVSGTVLVVNPARTDRPTAATAAQMLRGSGATILGVVPNQVATERKRFAYGDGYGNTQKGAKRAVRSDRRDKDIARPAPLADA